MTSPSTLIRRAKAADKKGHRAAAKRLREQAAAMRRVARARKRRSSKIIPKVKKGLMASKNGKWVVKDTTPAAPASEVAVDDSFGMVMKQYAEDDDRVRGVRRLHRDKTVCGFLAVAGHGELPPTVAVSGYMLTQIIDVLREAGYTEHGKF